MSRFQNLDVGFFDGIGKYDMPEISPVYELPTVERHIEFDYCLRMREDRYDRSKIGVHFFEDDYKFERVWTNPNRYGELLSKFGYVIGPDFSTYIDFPFPVRIFNHYRNNWLVKYWQICYNMIIVPTILWGLEDSFDYCFDGLPKNSIVAVTNVGVGNSKENQVNWNIGYEEMLKRLNPSKILFFTRNFAEMPGPVQYIRWKIHKGDQLNE